MNDKRPRFSVSVRRWFGNGLALGGYAVFIYGIGTLGYQCVFWLRDGVWSPLEVRLAWRWFGGMEPECSWLGIQKIALWILEMPLSVGSMLTGVLIVFIGNREVHKAAIEGDFNEFSPAIGFLYFVGAATFLAYWVVC